MLNAHVENEIKLRVQHPAGIEARLQELGAQYQRTEVQLDTYFRRPVNPIEGENIRVRKVLSTRENHTESFGYFTYKTPLDDSATFLRREEHERRVEDPDAEIAQLTAEGHVVIDKIMKTRKHYAIDGLDVGVDYVPGVGDFIEIEGSDEGIRTLAIRLGLDPKNHINTSYSALRDQQCNKKP